MKRNVSVTCSNHERSCTMTARACIHTHTHLHARIARVSEHTWAYHAPRTIFLQGVTRSPYPYVYAWNNRLTDGYALVSVRLHSLSPFSVTVPLFLPSFLPPFSHTLVTRVTYPRLVVKKLKKKKKIRTDSVEEARVSSARHWTPFRRGGRNWRCDTVCWRASH